MIYVLFQPFGVKLRVDNAFEKVRFASSWQWNDEQFFTNNVNFVNVDVRQCQNTQLCLFTVSVVKIKFVSIIWWIFEMILISLPAQTNFTIKFTRFKINFRYLIIINSFFIFHSKQLVTTIL